MDKDQNKQNIRRYLNGTYNCGETEEIAESLSSADGQEVLDELAAEVWEAGGANSPCARQDYEQYREEAETLLAKLLPRDYAMIKRVAYAAIGIAASVLLIMGGISLKRSWDVQNVVIAQMTTGYGEKKEITLPDGSQIVLNACSHLRYPTQFCGDTRDVELDGEAYFKITPNPDQPFHVQTSEFQVEVLGTEFNVKSYSHDLIQTVEVASGKVQVNLPEDCIRLKKQEKISMNRSSGEYSKTKRVENNVAIWRKGCLHFYQTPIADVVKELERKYNCNITFREGQTFDNLISGEHDNQSLESVLESLHYICGIKYKKDGKNIILYK